MALKIFTQKTPDFCPAFIVIYQRLMPPRSHSNNLHLGEFVDIYCQTRLEVSGLVAVNDITLGEFVKQRGHLGQHSSSCSLVRHGAQVAYSVTRGLGIIMIVSLAGSRLADTFQR